MAGLAIAPVGTGESIRLWQELRPGAPVVALNASAARITGVCRVRPDNAAAVELPMRRLAELGHTSVAFLSAPRRLWRTRTGCATSGGCARALGLRASVLYSPLTMPTCSRPHGAAGRPRTRPPRSSPTPTTPRMRSTRPRVSCGCGSGPEVSVVGHDDLATSELLDPPLATIRLDRRAMGRELMLRLLGQVPADNYVAPVELVERASLQPPALAGSAVPRPGNVALRQ